MHQKDGLSLCHSKDGGGGEKEKKKKKKRMCPLMLSSGRGAIHLRLCLVS